MARIEDLPLATPVYNDIDLFADISDSNNAKSNTIGSKVKAWLSDPTVTADDLQDWATKKVLTAAERTKLAGIQAGAQVNTVTSVNWQMGVVVLDADDIADTAARKMGNEIFNTSEKNKLDTAYTHSQAVTGNPHNVTAAQVWLGNVANERQLSRTAGNFNALPLKTDIQRNMNDLVPIQDAFDSDIVKKVTVGTQYIRYSSTIQLWRTSVNYHADTLVNSTTYEIRNIVIDEVTGGMYYCTVSHQSGANFASDLALWYWTPVLAWGGGSSPVYVIRWASNPTQAIPWWPRTPSGAFVGQLFVNTVTADILVRDGNDRVLNSATGGWGWGSGIIYSLSNGTVVASTTGDRGLASTGTGADKTYETSQVIDPVTWNTISQTFWPWGTVVFDDTDINFENWTTLNYDNTVVSNHNGDTVNYDWSTINSTNTEYNHTGDTINIDDSIVNSTNNTYNNDWDTVNNDNVVINNTNTTNNWWTYNNINIDNATITNTTVVWSSQEVFLSSNIWNDYSITWSWLTSYLESSLILFRVDNTNTWPITMDIDTLWVKQVVTTSWDQLISWVLNKNDTYILRYESSIDKLVIASSWNINLQNIVTDSFIDMPWLEFWWATYSLPWMSDSNTVVFDWSRYLYIANWTWNAIHKFDTFTNSQVATTPFSWTPFHFWSIYWNYLYVTSFSGNALRRVNLTTFLVDASVSVWNTPRSVAVDQLWTYAYVLNNVSNNISKVDLSTFTVVSTLAWVTTPRWREIDSTYLYVSHWTNTISRIDLSTFTVTSTLTVWNTPIWLEIVWWYLYCVNWWSNTVSKIDLSSFTSVWATSVWLWAFGIVWNATDLYVANSTDNTVSNINISSFTTIWNFAVGNWPQENTLVWWYLYIPNAISNNLSKVSLLNIWNPSSWYYRLYFKNDWKLYRKDSTWAEQMIWQQS